jgi:hypothetical protein
MKFFVFTEQGKTIYINLAHVVKIESDTSGDILTVRLVDGSAQQVTGDSQKALRLLLAQLTGKR